jgi:hypothetical protein
MFKNYLRTKKGFNGILLESIMHNNDDPGQAGLAYSTKLESLAVTII